MPPPKLPEYPKKEAPKETSPKEVVSTGEREKYEDLVNRKRVSETLTFLQLTCFKRKRINDPSHKICAWCQTTQVRSSKQMILTQQDTRVEKRTR